jgi:hypothetical protein
VTNYPKNTAEKPELRYVQEWMGARLFYFADGIRLGYSPEDEENGRVRGRIRRWTSCPDRELDKVNINPHIAAVLEYEYPAGKREGA